MGDDRPPVAAGRACGSSAGGVPGQEPLEWQLVFDQGTDPSDPLVRAQAEGALASARRAIG